jgi:hypothetical protein
MLKRIETEGRRSFLRGTALAAGAVALDALISDRNTAAGQSGAEAQGEAPVASTSTPLDGSASERNFRERAFELRKEVARRNRDATPPRLAHPTNGDEERYRTKIGSYAKGLQHTDDGEVVLSSYQSLINALSSGRPTDFETIAIGGARKLVNPQSGLAFELIGGDPRSFVQRVPPAFASREEAAEIAENYWMALLRDVPFSSYPEDPIANAAAADLNLFGSDAKVPKQDGVVTPSLLFRGLTAGDRVGPYLSQFFYLPLSFGANAIDQQIVSYAAGRDYMTTFADYLAVQRGTPTAAPAAGTKVYMRNGRDIGTWVRVDVLFQAYFQAALILLGRGSPRSARNPYTTSRTQVGNATLGDPAIQSLMGEVTTRALNAVWYQKWFVHRRLRPECFAARIHRQLHAGASYPIHSSILDSLSTPARLGGYVPADNALLPMAYPEGAPLHPAYGAGHATVAGACVTLLKAWFDGAAVVQNPKEPTEDGTALRDYQGPALTVQGELDKVASNVAMGRNIAGVHWRSDATESLKLGEAVASQLLREIKQTLNEAITFEFQDFSGRLIRI